jgi:hypothetical protein
MCAQRRPLSATTSTNAISAAKIAQIGQFAAKAMVRHSCDFASRSMMTTGIIASVATKITGSNGWITRPDFSCCQTPIVFFPA